MKGWTKGNSDLEVDIEDAKAATRILDASLNQTCKFQNGKRDINSKDNAATTKSSKEVLLMDILNERGALVESDWIDLAYDKGIDKAESKKIIFRLYSTHQVIQLTFAPPTYQSASRGGQ